MNWCMRSDKSYCEKKRLGRSILGKSFQRFSCPFSVELVGSQITFIVATEVEDLFFTPTVFPASSCGLSFMIHAKGTKRAVDCANIRKRGRHPRVGVALLAVEPIRPVVSLAFVFTPVGGSVVMFILSCSCDIVPILFEEFHNRLGIL